MEKWEYHTTIVQADINAPGVREFLRKRFPEWHPQRYHPICLVPQLNDLGEQGWEMVHLEPLREVGDNADVGFTHGGQAAATKWSNQFLCVFKRRVLE